MLRPFSGPASGRKFTPFGAVRPGVFILAALLCLPASLGVAHEGHDLAPSSMAPNAPGHPRLAASSEVYELVAILEGERLTIYLDRFDDNAPVTDAAITVTIDDETVVADAAADGSYAVASKRFGSSGLVELVFDVRRPGADDLLIGKMSLRNAASAGDPSELTASPVQWWSYLRHGAEDHLILMSLILLLGLALGQVLRRRRVVSLPVVALLIPLLATFGITPMKDTTSLKKVRQRRATPRGGFRTGRFSCRSPCSAFWISARSLRNPRRCRKRLSSSAGS
jgi:hypothetical protein